MYACTLIHTHTHAYIHMHTCAHHAHMHTHAPRTHTHARARTRTHAHTHTHTHTQEKSVQAAASGVLGEVKRKQSDIQYHLKLASALRDLRDIRREASRKKGMDR